MSEPTIKPRRFACFQGCDDVSCVDANHLDEIAPESRHHHNVIPLYTHDDLVAVAREAFAICNVEGVNGEKVTPEEIVERLTGVKR